MRVLVIGGNGTLGRAVVNDLKSEFEVITAARSDADITVDILSTESIHAMYKRAGVLDAVIFTAGSVVFKPLQELSENDMLGSLSNKVMGQINTVLIGRNYIKSGGSFTLTSGVLSDQAIASGICASVANNAVNGFVKSAALELIPDNIRINAVSPTILEESYDAYYPYFSGFYPVSSKKVAFAYRKSVTGIQTGQVFVVE